MTGETKGFIRLIVPIPALTLPHIFSMCFSQLNFSSKSTPKHVKVSVRGIGALFNRTQLSLTFLFKLRDDPMNITFDFIGWCFSLGVDHLTFDGGGGGWFWKKIPARQFWIKKNTCTNKLGEKISYPVICGKNVAKLLIFSLTLYL